MALINIGGIYFEESVVGAGTGNYNSFLRLQSTLEEEGFNTDDGHEADNKDGIWTHSILVGELVAIEVDGHMYYEIRLDLNEGNAAGDEAITLEDFRLFYSAAAADGDDYDNDFVDLTKVFDLGDAVALTDVNTGSGTDDYRFLIPVELFPDTSAYFTLYSRFSGTDGGFEEWRALSQDVGDGLPAITLVKDADPVSVSEDTPTTVTYTYTITSQSSDTDPLTLTAFMDDFGTLSDTSDDIDLLTGASGTDLGIYYVSGDDNADGLLQNTETWIFQLSRNNVLLNAGDTLVNIAGVNAIDDEGNNVSDTDDATVTGLDVLPDIHIEKDASVSSVQAGTATSVTFTYVLTNTSPSPLDPLTLTSLMDDMGTVDTSDDVDLLALGTFVGGDTSGDGFLDQGEIWTFTYTTDVTLMPGETRTNIVTVNAVDDEGSGASDIDDASIVGANLGRTPGFWSNNGSLLWDGNTGTFPRAGGLGIVAAGQDLAYAIRDLNGDGTIDSAGNRQYLMIGDWDKDGVADPDENVLVINRSDALSLLNASEKLQGDGRYMLARDVVASWLNYLGGSYVGDSDDSTSAMHYIDEATAWLMQTTNGDHVLSKAELSPATKIGTNTTAWNTGFNFDATAGVQNDLPAAGEHDLGDAVDLDILGGGTIHSGLDHYNNFGFI